MSKSNEPTAQSPNAPSLQKQVEDLTAQVAILTRLLVAQPQPPEADEKRGTFAIETGQRPGEIYEDGKDPTTGRPIYRKRRWSRADILKQYEPVTFVPMLTIPVRPHGVIKGWELIAGVTITVPSIVKDIYDGTMLTIRKQTEGYPGYNESQERQAFEATRKSKGPHFTPIKHVDYGWNEKALAAASDLSPRKDLTPYEVGHEPEMGFPGGHGGKALPEPTV